MDNLEISDRLHVILSPKDGICIKIKHAIKNILSFNNQIKIYCNDWIQNFIAMLLLVVDIYFVLPSMGRKSFWAVMSVMKNIINKTFFDTELYRIL
jgi:hypothetical protein